MDEFSDDEFREAEITWFRSDPTQKLRKGMFDLHEQHLTRLRELARSMGDESAKEQMSYTAGWTDSLEWMLGLIEGFGPTRED